MVRSVTTFDPDWTDEDIAAALGWVDDEASRCAGCGLPRDETFDPQRANSYEATAWSCHACATRDRAQRAWTESKGEQAGLYWQITERE